MKVKQLKLGHGIELDDRIKVAFLISMLPTEFQDYVFQWADGKSYFKDMKDNVLALAMNRASLGRPMPMKVDKVKAENWYDGPKHEDTWGYECYDCEAGVQGAYVGESRRRCGGLDTMPVSAQAQRRR